MSKSDKRILKKVILPIIIVAIAVGAYFYFKGNGDQNYDFISVKKANLVQEVSVTGNVKPAQKVKLAFEKGGKITAIYAKIGEAIRVGDALVILDSSELSAKLAQAKANLKTEEATLNNYIQGTRQEEIDVKEAELEKAQQDLQNYYDSVLNILYDSYNKSDDAARTKSDELFASDELSPVLNFSTMAFAKVSSESQRRALTDILNLWLVSLNGINSNSLWDELDEAINKAQLNLASVRNFLDTIMDAINNSTSLSQTNINAYKSNINTARTNISTAITNVNTQEQDIASQKLTVDKIRNELNLALAGKTPQEIEAQRAKVEQARANVLDYESQLAKGVLRSPINGAVTKQNAEIGEIAAANASIISIISRGQFQVETNVPEADIAKIKVGDSANVTLDAYGSDVVFKTRVIKIEPAETVIEGVSTYKTTLEFEGEDERILSGMTANIDIISAKKDDVLVLPYRAISAKDSVKFVSVLSSDGKTLIEKEVKTGIRGSDGNIEIISGLNEGEKVVISKS